MSERSDIGFQEEPYLGSLFDLCDDIIFANFHDDILTQMRRCRTGSGTWMASTLEETREKRDVGRAMPIRTGTIRASAVSHNSSIDILIRA